MTHHEDRLRAIRPEGSTWCGFRSGLGCACWAATFWATPILRTLHSRQPPLIPGSRSHRTSQNGREKKR